ncbi:hypothetical protein WA158_001634 [Blastocystis sp. Blastoise]
MEETSSVTAQGDVEEIENITTLNGSTNSVTSDESGLNNSFVQNNDKYVPPDYIKLAHLEQYMQNTDGLDTTSSLDNHFEYMQFLKDNDALDEHGEIRLMVDKHCKYISQFLKSIPFYYQTFDSSKPWLFYYLLHPLTLMKQERKDLYPLCAKAILSCQSIYGGFSGSQYEYPHVMCTYAAVMTLCILGDNEALKQINRYKMYNLFLSLKHSDGSFSVHEHGESDIRGTYCVIILCSLLNMLTPEITAGVVDYVKSLRTYEGGYAGEYGGEAHGGYNHCAIAILRILKEPIYTPELDIWLSYCQAPLEGGFAGRINKLVDGCYTWYQGAAFDLVALDRPYNHTPSFNTAGIERFCYKACQEIENNSPFIHGGLRDKPSVSIDPYHTCFVTSGLAIVEKTKDTSLLEINDPIYNITVSQLTKAQCIFKSMPCPPVQM